VPEPLVTHLHAAKSESLAMTIGACEPGAPITSGPVENESRDEQRMPHIVQE